MRDGTPNEIMLPMVVELMRCEQRLERGVELWLADEKSGAAVQLGWMKAVAAELSTGHCQDAEQTSSREL